MTEPIDSIRSVRRESLPFEKVMSSLTVAIGDVERLPDLEPDQLNRLRQAVIRLSNAERNKSRG